MLLSEYIASYVKRLPISAQAVKNVCAGGTAEIVKLGVLYLLTEFVHLYYLASAVYAFLVAVTVSFVLQKYWTFGDRGHEQAHMQAGIYLALHVTNLALNTALLYAFVTYLHFWYLFSQVVISLLLAIVVFFINRHFIFRGSALRMSGQDEVV